MQKITLVPLVEILLNHEFKKLHFERGASLMTFPKSILKGIWQVQKRSHSLRVLLSKCYYYLNRNNRRIHGKRNVLNIEGAYLKKVEINVAGDDNYISIRANSRISNVKIDMKGSGHCLEIGESCILTAGSFWFQTRDCTIIVGNQTNELTWVGIFILEITTG